MITSPDHMRELRRGEEAQVDDLLALAFKGQDEVRLVHRLRKDRAIAGEMVISADNRIVAYAGLSQMIQPKGWLCLAPVAVHPDWQGRHIGSRMVGMITEWARLSKKTIVVLGEPGFYARNGFSSERAAQLTSPYPISHTLLAGPGETAPTETLVYPKAFG